MASPRTKLALLALIPLGILAALWLVTAARPSDDPGSAVEISGRMPPLGGAAVAGGEVGPEDYRGKVVVVNFWASWCAPCRLEQPGLQRLWEAYGGRVAFIGVNFKDDPPAARAHLEEFGVTYPSVEDRTGAVAHAFGVPYLPATILVDATGEMRWRLLGAQRESDLRARIEAISVPE